MKPTTALLSDLLPYLDAYLDQPTKDWSVAHFAAWLLENAEPKSLPKSRIEGRHSLDSQIGEHLYLLNRYVRIYSKMALKQAPLNSLDDFTIMATLNGRDLTKSEVIQRNQLDFNTGIGIIRRLLQLGLLGEYTDQTDRRAKRLTITEAGRAAMEGVFAQMGQVMTIVVGTLNKTDQQVLLDLLQRLDDYHRQNLGVHLKAIEAQHSDFKL